MLDQRIRVLLIEDNPADARLIDRALGASGGKNFQLHRVGLLRDGLRRLEQERYDVVLLDLGLPDSWGLDTLGRIRAKVPSVATVVLTGADDEHLAFNAAQHGAQDYMVKGNVGDVEMARGLLQAVERKRAEEAIRRSEERARLLIESVSEAIVVLNDRGEISWMSPSASRVLRFSADEVVGARLVERVHADDIPLLDRLLEGAVLGVSKPVDLRVSDDDGAWRVFETDVRDRRDEELIGGLVVTLRDVTEKRRLEQVLARTQRVESVGRLAGGIAHDFNNLLTAVLSYCQLLERGLPDDGKLREYVGEIRNAGQRAAGLTRHLLVFSRGHAISPQVVNLNDLIEGMDNLLRRTLPENILIGMMLDPELGLARTDAGQFEQVVLNLAINARDAMADGGTLTIDTRNVTWGPEEAPPNMPPGSYVMLEVRDTGSGMADFVKDHMFEPFFTTKQLGSGTGLGLAVCHGIVKQSGGHIGVESELGRGTSIQVYLPRTSEAETVSPPPERVERPTQGGSETILVVEDEAYLRKVVVRSLKEVGYQPLEASSPTEAIQIALHHEQEIDLLLTDVVMHGMLGTELAEVVREHRPGIRVLLMSGYAPSSAGSGRGKVQVALTKPFTPDTLTRTVRDCLDGK